jgi:hypothetical protein
MTKEKQIEEMAFNLIMATTPLGVKDLTKQFDYNTVATDLYEQYDWRKAADVREIFEEIENLMLDGAIGGKYPVKVINPDKYTELKKKYTEGEG